MSFGDGLKAEMDHRANQNAMNDALLSDLPRVPDRGSYEWWVKNVCRQNTGQHFLDSGIAYGYTYNRPFAESDEHVVFVGDDYHEVSVSVHLPALLSRAYDASDERAEALEEILYWIGSVVYKKKSWYEIISGGYFLDTLNRLLSWAVLEKRSGDGFYVVEKRVAVIAREDGQDGLEYDWERDRIDWVEFEKEAVDEFDKKALITVYEALGCPGDPVIKDEKGFYTYNFDTQLDQDLVLHMIIEAENGDELHVLSAHTGCDARSGFSTPVVAVFDGVWYEDIRYLLDAYADCHRCDWQSEGVYWGRYDEMTADEAREWLQKARSIEKLHQAQAAGQMEMDIADSKGAIDKLLDGQTEGVVVAVLKHIDAELAKAGLASEDGVDDEDLVDLFPPVVAVSEETEWFVPERYQGVPAGQAIFMCPKCHRYTAGAFELYV